MLELIELMVLIVVLSAIGLPSVVFMLARLGYFEPLEFELLGHLFRFSPKRIDVVAHSSAITGVFFPSITPSPMTMMTSAMPAALVVACHLYVVPIRDLPRSFGEIGTTITYSTSATRKDDVKSEDVS